MVAENSDKNSIITAKERHDIRNHLMGIISIAAVAEMKAGLEKKAGITDKIKERVDVIVEILEKRTEK
jgi:hypothetical protein